MKLLVTDNIAETSFDTVIISIDEFCDVHTHPYIATAGFDVIVVDLDPKIPNGILKAIVGKYRVIPRIISELSVDTVRLLSEIYREEGNNLRYSWLKERDISSIVSRLEEKFNWRSFYGEEEDK